MDYGNNTSTLSLTGGDNIDDIGDTLLNLETTTSNNQILISNNTNLINDVSGSLNTQVQDVSSQVQDISGVVDENVLAIDNNNLLIDDVSGSLTSLLNVVTDLSTNFYTTEHGANIDDVSGSLTSLLNVVTDLSTNFYTTEHGANIINVSNTLTDLSGSHYALQNVVVDLSTNFYVLTGTTIPNLNIVINDLSGSHYALENVVVDLSGNVATNVSTIADISGLVHTNISTITDISGRVTTVEDTLQDLQDELDGLNTTDPDTGISLFDGIFGGATTVSLAMVGTLAVTAYNAAIAAAAAAATANTTNATQAGEIEALELSRQINLVDSAFPIALTQTNTAGIYNLTSSGLINAVNLEATGEIVVGETQITPTTTTISGETITITGNTAVNINGNINLNGGDITGVNLLGFSGSSIEGLDTLEFKTVSGASASITNLKSVSGENFSISNGDATFGSKTISTLQTATEVGNLISNAISAIVGSAGDGYDTLPELQEKIENKVDNSGGDTMTGDYEIQGDFLIQPTGDSDAQIRIDSAVGRISSVLLTESPDFGVFLRYDGDTNDFELGMKTRTNIEDNTTGTESTLIKIARDCILDTADRLVQFVSNVEISQLDNSPKLRLRGSGQRRIEFLGSDASYAYNTSHHDYRVIANTENSTNVSFKIGSAFLVNGSPAQSYNWVNIRPFQNKMILGTGASGHETFFKDNSTFEETLDVDGLLTGNGGADITGATDISGDTTITGNLTASNLIVSGTNVVATGALIAGTNITTTTGYVSAGSNVTATDNVTATTGYITATQGYVNAGTNVIANNNITATTGDITATAGSVNAGTNVIANNNITATTGNITATAGSVTAGTTLTVGGTATLNSTLEVVGDIIGSLTSFTNNVDIGGTAKINSTLEVVGDIIGNITTFTNNVVTGGYVLAGGYISSTSNITANGDVTAIQGDIIATAGDIIATAGDIIATAGDASFNGSLTVGGNITLGGRPLVTSTLQLTPRSVNTTSSTQMMFHFPYTGDATVAGVTSVSSSTRQNANLSYSSPYPYRIVGISIFYDSDNNTNSTDIRYSIKDEDDHSSGAYGTNFNVGRGTHTNGDASKMTFVKTDNAQRSDSGMLVTPVTVLAKQHLWIRGDLSSSSANEYAILLHIAQSA